MNDAICQKCGTPQPYDGAYCWRCGAKLAVPDAGTPESASHVTSNEIAENSPFSKPLEPPIGPDIRKLQDRPRHEDIVDDEFLKRYSFGPGCGFYYWSRALLPFALFAAFMNAAGQLLESIWDAEASDSNFLVATIALFFIVVYLTVIVWSGRISRKKRWVILKWNNFEEFRKNELAWNRAGIVGWALFLLFVFSAFIIALLGGPIEP